MGPTPHSPYYTERTLQDAAQYWERKDAKSVKLDPARFRAMVEAYIMANNTCALATGAGDFVRCTPIEYSWHDGAFWMFSEGGKKFVGLARNPNVCLAVFDRYEGFGSLHGVQAMGTARLVEPFSQEYLDHAAYKKIPEASLKRLSQPMHLICVRPRTIECIFSDFKALGCAPRQTLVLEEG